MDGEIGRGGRRSGKRRRYGKEIENGRGREMEKERGEEREGKELSAPTLGMKFTLMNANNFHTSDTSPHFRAVVLRISYLVTIVSLSCPILDRLFGCFIRCRNIKIDEIEIEYSAQKSNP
jgi:hypothetical protein